MDEVHLGLLGKQIEESDVDWDMFINLIKDAIDLTKHNSYILDLFSAVDLAEIGRRMQASGKQYNLWLIACYLKRNNYSDQEIHKLCKFIDCKAIGRYGQINDIDFNEITTLIHNAQQLSFSQKNILNLCNEIDFKQAGLRASKNSICWRNVSNFIATIRNAGLPISKVSDICSNIDLRSLGKSVPKNTHWTHLIAFLYVIDKAAVSAESILDFCKELEFQELGTQIKETNNVINWGLIVTFLNDLSGVPNDLKIAFCEGIGPDCLGSKIQNESDVWNVVLNCIYALSKIGISDTYKRNVCEAIDFEALSKKALTDNITWEQIYLLASTSRFIGISPKQVECFVSNMDFNIIGKQTKFNKTNWNTVLSFILGSTFAGIPIQKIAVLCKSVPFKYIGKLAMDRIEPKDLYNIFDAFDRLGQYCLEGNHVTELIAIGDSLSEFFNELDYVSLGKKYYQHEPNNDNDLAHLALILLGIDNLNLSAVLDLYEGFNSDVISLNITYTQFLNLMSLTLDAKAKSESIGENITNKLIELSNIIDFESMGKNAQKAEISWFHFSSFINEAHILGIHSKHITLFCCQIDFATLAQNTVINKSNWRIIFGFVLQAQGQGVPVKCIADLSKELNLMEIGIQARENIMWDEFLMSMGALKPASNVRVKTSH